MCSCAFYPLHLVYSGLIWTFGVRVNYISKLFLHFLHSRIYIYYILASLVSYFLLICKKNTAARSLAICIRHTWKIKTERKLLRFTVSLRKMSIFTKSHLLHHDCCSSNIDTHLTTRIPTRSVHAHGCSMTLSLSVSPDNNNHLPRRKKYPSLQVYVIHCANLFSNCV